MFVSPGGIRAKADLFGEIAARPPFAKERPEKGQYSESFTRRQEEAENKVSRSKIYLRRIHCLLRCIFFNQYLINSCCAHDIGRQFFLYYFNDYIHWRKK